MVAQVACEEGVCPRRRARVLLRASVLTPLSSAQAILRLLSCTSWPRASPCPSHRRRSKDFSRPWRRARRYVSSYFLARNPSGPGRVVMLLTLHPSLTHRSEAHKPMVGRRSNGPRRRQTAPQAILERIRPTRAKVGCCGPQCKFFLPSCRLASSTRGNPAPFPGVHPMRPHLVCALPTDYKATLWRTPKTAPPPLDESEQDTPGRRMASSTTDPALVLHRNRGPHDDVETNTDLHKLAYSPGPRDTDVDIFELERK